MHLPRRPISRRLGLTSVSIFAIALSACGGSSEQAATKADAPETQSETQSQTHVVADTPTNPHASSAQPAGSRGYWPEQVDLTVLRENAANNDPMGNSFDYASAFESLDLDAVKKDIEAVMTTSQDWWPSDYGHYGPFFIRMAWHSAGTYRTLDGRGGAGAGQQRFEPLNSWPDNKNLDKAQRLLWPIKQKYGRNISWADLMVLTGNVAMESMGFKTLGFAGGRIDAWTPDIVYWGPENEFLADERFNGDRKLKRPLAAAELGLIYVNPEGPNGNPDPLAAAHDIRTTFGRMAMNDEETVALIAGGHTFGKAHGAHKPDECLGPEPAAAAIESQGLGWKNKCGSGNGVDTVTSGLEGAWTSAPAQWTHQFLTNLFAFEWKQTRSPGGAIQWVPTDEGASQLVPDAHDPDKRHAPIMLTTDLSLKEDPKYREISERFLENPEEFDKAFARAWFKLTHRDMGPRARYLGDAVPQESLIWQDPIPAVNHPLIGTSDIAALKRDILNAEISVSDLVRTAWSAAASYRDTDKRGGVNGARIRLAPQKDWAANDPEALQSVIAKLEDIRATFNDAQARGKQVSLSDMIVLGGAAGIEQAARNAGYSITVPFTPGRMDASAAQTDAASFAVLEPKADGFRNYREAGFSGSATDALVDKADLLNLNVPEMTALVGGLRTLSANSGNAQHGVFTSDSAALTNDFFTNLLDVSTQWKPTSQKGVYEGYDRASGTMKWTATDVDLVFGSNSELRAVAEYYAYGNAEQQFIEDFVSAWTKVMKLDRFDL